MDIKKNRREISKSPAKIKRPVVDKTLLTGLAEILSWEMKVADHERASRAYLLAVRNLVEFTGNEKLQVKDITPSLMCNFEAYLIKKGQTMNSVSFYMRNLRTIYNKAVQRGLLPLSRKSPFEHVHTGIYESKRSVLTKDEMISLSRLLKNSPKPLSEAMNHALFYFLFCFHACGMLFKSMAFMKKSSIYQDCIHYSRTDNGRPLIVKITPPMQEILNYFSPMVQDSPYLFPVIRPGRGNERQQYETALTVQNRRLRGLGKMAGIRDKLVSSYMARHSWAAIAMEENIPIAVICNCLGHHNERETIAYLDSLKMPEMDLVSESVSDTIS